MLQRFKNKYFHVSSSQRLRLYRMMMLLGAFVSIFAIIISFLTMDKSVALISCIPLFGLVVIAFLGVINEKRVYQVATAVGFLANTLFFPIMFIISGGIESGAPIWLVLGLVFNVIMFSGRKLTFFIILTATMDVFIYNIARRHPEQIVKMASHDAALIDSIVALFCVSAIICGMIRYQIYLYEAERKLVLEQKEQLEIASKSKNAFFANMSHEIRTPINTIIGLNEMILRESQSEEVQDYAKNIQMASKMLLRLVNDILDLSQMEIKKMEILPVEYSVENMLEELVGMFQIRMKEKKLEFYLEIDKNLPKELYGDEKRIKQILINILTNAVKYTKEGGVTLAVNMENKTEDSITMIVSVSDTGIGIRKEDLNYLFDSFRRVDEKNNIGIEGSGLGLSITKQLVELMNGEIMVDSIYTKGSVFTVILQQKIVNKEPIGEIDIFAKNRNGGNVSYERSFEAPKARVLAVDDSPMNTFVVKKMLKDTKVQVDVAGSGSECLKKTKQKHYHLILMDYMMTGMNGAETLEEIRKQENGLCKETPVILLSASSTNESVKLCEQYGFDSYLEKPMQGLVLEQKVQSFLPEEIVTYRKNWRESSESFTGIQRIAKKRKEVCITSDCVTDLTEELLEQYKIKLIYLFIRTKQGRFADSKEIDSDNLVKYMQMGAQSVYVDSASVEEYEEFFAETLTRAENVIHISMAKGVGQSYENSKMAAQCFGHVHVIDSGQISGGQALLTLYAAKLAKEGYSVQEICDNICKMKDYVESKFFVPTADILFSKNYFNKTMGSLFMKFHIHPIIGMKQSKPVLKGIKMGNTEKSWKRWIYLCLLRRWNINQEIVYITHVGCSEKQLECVKEEVLRRVPFKKVIVQKASAVNACNSGVHTIGIAFYKNNITR
ncbi:MAG: DegV family EDD domain-containing protein [Lachnospiraceae bacterium]|nr:DegV family EDD domain-containing protein [Lachnospiraceae bacterium]